MAKEEQKGFECFNCKTKFFTKISNDTYRCKGCGHINYRSTDEDNIKYVNACTAMENYHFSDAYNIYHNLYLQANESKFKAQAIFGMLKATYGIIYIESNYKLPDEDCKKKIPTFSNYDKVTQSLLDTKLYKEIKELNFDEKDKFLNEIKELDKDFKKIRKELDSDTLYDVFICVKISSLIDWRSKTNDYTSYAVDIYDKLTKDGLKVFCSEKNKVTGDAEIFAALAKSKVMLVISESKEHLESSWVQSEWRRWLNFIEIGKKDDYSLIALFPTDFMVPPTFEGKNINNRFKDTKDVYKKIDDIFIRNSGLETIQIPDDTLHSTDIKLMQINKAGEVAVSNETIIISGYEQLEKFEYQNAKRYFSKDKSKSNLITWSKFYCKLCQKNKKNINPIYITYFNNAMKKETNNEIRKLIFKCLYKETIKRIDMNNYDLAADLYKLVIKWPNDYRDKLFNEMIKIISKKIKKSDGKIYILINSIKEVNIYNTIMKELKSEEEEKEILKENTPFICDIIQNLTFDIKKYYGNSDWTKLAYENFEYVITKDRNRFDLYFQMIQCNIGCRENNKLYKHISLFSDDEFVLLTNLSSKANDKSRTKYIELLLKALLDFFENSALNKKNYYNLLKNVYIKLLTYIPESVFRNSLCINYLYKLGDICLEKRLFKCAKKCYELIKDINKFDYIAYWKILLCKLKVVTDDMVKESNKKIINIPEFDSVLELLNNDHEKSAYYKNIQFVQEVNCKIKFNKEIKNFIIRLSFIIFLSLAFILIYCHLAPKNEFFDSDGNVIYTETFWFTDNWFGDKTDELPIAPTKDGYTFIEWEKEGDYSYIAKYEPNKYEITFDSNGGNNLSGVQVEFDSVLNSLPIPSKEGYEFDGWYYNDTLVNNEIYNYLENVTFEAKWNYVSYNLEYILNDGIADNPDSYNIDSEIIINNPVKKGHTFIGWKINNDLMVESYSISKGTIGNITLEAVYKPNEYVITLYSNNKLIENINVTYGKEFTLDDYKLNGYTFLGWYYNEESVTSGVYNFDGNINLNAKHEIINYSINYDLDGGIATNPSIYNVDSEFVINNPTKVGYDFIGWNYEDEMYETVVINKGTTGDKTFKAIFDPKTYKVTLDSNGGSVSVNEVSVKYDEIYNYPRPKKSGYVFKGWYYNEVDYTQVAYKEVTDITLKAKWELVSYKIEYDLDGGTANNPESYNAESEFTLNNPTKKGYTFKGWKIENGTTLYQKISISKGSFGNKKYVAVYEINTYIINYNANGGTINSNSVNVKYDEYVTLQTPSKYGYDFDGWYYGSSKLSTFKYNYDKNITVEAKWKPTVYIISYGNGTTNVKHEYTIEDEFIIDNPTLKGHVFNYWINESNKKELTTIKIEKGTTGNMSFTPVFTPIRYSISYGNNSIDVIYGSSYNLTEIPTKDYHTFKSFSYNGKDFPLSGTFDYTEDIILTINWTPNKYNVTFNASGDVGTVTNSFEYGSRITFPSVKKENYILLNWESLTEGYNINDPMPGKNIVLKANWLKVKQNIDLSTDSGDRDVVIDDGYESWPFIDRTGSHSETIYPSLDKQALKDAGYYNVWITITFDCYETKAGYQDVTVYSYADKVLYDNSFESGGDGSANKEWDRITFKFYTSIDNLYTDGSFWIKWSAHGEDSDEWKLGWTSITVEAVKDVIILL